MTGLRLAAAVRAWKSVQQGCALGGLAPKQAAAPAEAAERERLARAGYGEGVLNLLGRWHVMSG